MHDRGMVHQEINFNNVLVGPQNLKLSVLAKTEKDELKAPETLENN